MKGSTALLTIVFVLVLGAGAYFLFFREKQGADSSSPSTDDLRKPRVSPLTDIGGVTAQPPTSAGTAPRPVHIAAPSAIPSSSAGWKGTATLPPGHIAPGNAGNQPSPSASIRPAGIPRTAPTPALASTGGNWRGVASKIAAANR